MMCLRDKPPRLGFLLIGKKTFVAMTTSSRRAKSFSARPVTSSLTPLEYISAVSKKLMPASRARLIKGRLDCSSKTQSRHSGVP